MKRWLFTTMALAALFIYGVTPDYFYKTVLESQTITTTESDAFKINKRWGDGTLWFNSTNGGSLDITLRLYNGIADEWATHYKDSTLSITVPAGMSYMKLLEFEDAWTVADSAKFVFTGSINLTAYISMQ